MKYGIIKKCVYCNNKFETKPRFVTYCSTKCKNPLNRGEYVPWNKDKKMSIEYIETKMNIEGLKRGWGWNKGSTNPKQSEKWKGEGNPNWNGKLNNIRSKKNINTKFQEYKNKVKKATYRSVKELRSENLIPKNTGKRKDQYQLDHIIPYEQGMN